jgi:hypothetical protein
MIIKYPDGTTLNALLLSRGNDTLRVTVPGADDVRTFTLMREAWISEAYEPVKIEFEWPRRGVAQVTNETECVCSRELASRLISLLLAEPKVDDLIEKLLYVFSTEDLTVHGASRWA